MTTYSAKSPESVLDCAFRAFRERSASDLAEVIAPASLLAFREAVIREARPQWDLWTAETLRKHNPGMPIEVAEYQSRQMEQQRSNHASELLARFPDTNSIEELEALAPLQLLERALRGIPNGPIEIAHCRVLGHVLDGQKIAFVVFWLGTETEIEFDEPRLAKMERVADEWKIVLDPYGAYLMPGFRNMFFGLYSESEA